MINSGTNFALILNPANNDWIYHDQTAIDYIITDNRASR